MKRRFFSILMVLTILVTLALTTDTFAAASSKKTPTDRPVKTSEAEANLPDLQKVMQAESYSEALQWNDLDGEAEAYISGAYSKETLMFLLNTGRMLGYLDDFKAAGIVDQNYTSPYGGTNAANTTQATETKTNEEIITKKCEETAMWAKSEVNIRENGSTGYRKIGSLNKGDQVTVTGIDSTGWYEIRKSDGTVGHVSDKYLTEEDPSVKATPTEEAEDVVTKRENEIISIDGRTVVWYNAETEEEEEVVFSENTPLEEVEDMAMKYLINGAELVEQPSEETTSPEEVVEGEEVSEEPSPVETEPVVEETTNTPSTEEPVQVEGDVEEPQDKTEKMREFVQGPIFILGSIIIGLLAFIGGIVAIVINRKRR